MRIDHVVLWVNDPDRALAFYVDVIGLRPERAEEFAEGAAPFPSVRLNETTIFDLMGRALLPDVQEATRGPEAGGSAINHVCLSMSKEEYAALANRLNERGIELTPGGSASFGAQGVTADSAYFSDPDGNILEIRHYEREK